MIYFASNFKLLRGHNNLSQSALSEKLLISRANLAKYEGSVHEPSFEVLIRISRYFKVSLDMILTVDMSKMSESEITNTLSDRSMLFPMQVDNEGNNMIEVVPHSAQAGYTGMYSDAGYIESLDNMHLPFLHHKGKCRAFPISGDSMPPYGDGSYVIGEYVTSKEDIRPNRRYIFLSRDEGIVFKRIKDIKEGPVITLHSDNPKYSPFDMNWTDVVEIWEFVAAVSVGESTDNYVIDDMLSRIEGLQKDLKSFSSRFKT